MAGWGTCRDCRQRIWWGQNPFNAEKAAPFDLDQQTLHWDTCSATPRVQVGSVTHRVTHCRACRAEVFWDVTRNGKRRPYDAAWPHAVHFDTCVGEEPARTRTSSQPKVPAYLSDHLECLGLTEWPVEAAVLTSVFRKLALVRHPDMGGSHDGFIALRRSYDYLKARI